MEDYTKSPKYDPLLNLKQACEYAGGLHEATLRKAVREGELACVRRKNAAKPKPGAQVGKAGTPSERGTRLYFRLSQLNAWIRRREQPTSRRVSEAAAA